ncbi:MAG: Mu transposase C-terminal domain-containing protein [Sterolibacterium sp.]|nr:Mu transposase C-terminal domain-containing protein [Sterolibacterium sp.]
MSKSHYSAAELAALKLPGIPTTERGINQTAMRSGWQFQEVKAKGGRTGTRKEYAVATLPPETRTALLERQLHPTVSSSAVVMAAPLPVASKTPTLSGLLLPVPAVQAMHTLTDKQRAGSDARKGVLAAIHRLQANSGCSQEAAMTTLLTTAKTGKLEPSIDSLLKLARDPRGRSGDGYPSIRTLKRWLKAPDLAPKATQQDMNVPPWAPALMKLYGQPQKPSLSSCMEQLPAQLPRGITAPSYHAANRFINKLGNVERQHGRMLPRELKNLLPFKRRDASSFTPDAIYTADGHTFDAEVSHPRHGKAFRPEITTVLSVPTRRCVGWSAGLAESTWAVMDALRNAVETGGIPLIWYVDNGSGYKNVSMEDEVVGFTSRLGTSIEHSLPYNSQARGIEERSHKSIWVRGAKKLPTYMGADMDRQARQKVFKITRAQLRDTGSSPLLMAWTNFLTWCQGEIDAYNARPHRSLPKLRDPASGKLRHMSPNEAWQAAINEGWAPTMVSAADAKDLFRPEIIATTTRGEIRLFNNLYFSHDLKEFTGEKVRVGYDIHNGDRVWVRDMDGRLICVAEFEANKTNYFPQSAIDKAAIGRAQARERRLEIHLQEVRDELEPPALLEHQQAAFIPMQMPAERVEVAEENLLRSAENVISMPTAGARPWLTNDPDQYRWLMKNPAQWKPDDAAWLLDYTASEDYADLASRYEFQGVAWRNEDAARARAKLEGFEVVAG